MATPKCGPEESPLATSPSPGSPDGPGNRSLSRVLETLQQWHRQLEAALNSAHPALVVVAMAILPLGPFPASVLFVLAGNRFGTGLGFLLGVGALAANMTLGYWLARRGLRGPLERWLARRGKQVPTFDPADELRFLLLFRITPGMPLFIQNYVLGLAGVRFSRYLPVSLAAQAPYVLAFTWFGQSLTEKSGWKIVLAVAGIVAAILLVSLLRKVLARKKA